MPDAGPVTPTAPEPDPDEGAGPDEGARPDADGGGDEEASDGTGSGAGAKAPVAELEEDGEIAADYIEGLLDIADLDGDIDIDVEGDRAVISVEGGNLDHLVGPHGAVLDALQELTRLAVLTDAGRRSRLMLDIAGHRRQRRTALTELGATTAAAVKQSGEPVRLEPMGAFERKVVHDAIAAAGLRSESEGAEPQRRVVVYPA